VNQIKSLSNLEEKDVEILQNKLVLNTSNQYLGRNNNLDITNQTGDTMK